jgi:hypothetical protein
MPDDLRQGLIGFFDVINTTLRAIYSERDTEAARRLMDVPVDTPPIELLTRLFEFQRLAAEASGAGWPDLDLNRLAVAGSDWHVFPNQIFLMSGGGTLCYRSRPDGDDPDSCIYDVWSLVRYAPGAEPPLERQFFYGKDDWKSFSKISIILQQDFDNMEEVQKGMKNDAFAFCRTNPLQESSVSNLLRWIRHYVYDDPVSPTSRSGTPRSAITAETADTAADAVPAE